MSSIAIYYVDDQYIPNCRHATIKTSPVVLDRIMDGVDGLTSILTE